VLDWGILSEYADLSEDGEHEAATIVALFLEHTPPLLAGLREAARSGDTAQAQRAAHDLGSTSETIGAIYLGKMARALEQQTRLGTSVDLSAVKHLEEAFAEVQKALLNLS
jgi:HPt (histidine-containing phosphotransfer) domain-containing protein